MRALAALENLEHRGAAGADADTGDGAGILVAAPRRVLPRRGRGGSAASRARTASAMCFLPQDDAARGRARAARSTATVEAEGQRVARLARRAGRRGARRARRRRLRAARPAARSWPRRRSCVDDQDAFERKLYVIRRVVELEARADLIDPELLLAHDRLQGDADRAAAAAATTPISATSGLRARSRSSTRASRRTRSRAGSSPIRTGCIAHNGEINTLRGNVNWMRARESQLASELFGDDLAQGAARSSGRAAPTRPRSTTSSSCSCSAAARCRTR